MCKRMIQPDIVNTGKFLKLSAEAQLLYLRSCLTQDVDGISDFAELAWTLRIAEDAIDELEESDYILKVGEDLYAVTDWHIHNTIRKEAYYKHRPEAAKLMIDENKRYFLCDDMSQNFVRAKGEREYSKDISNFHISRESAEETVENVVENSVENFSTDEPVENPVENEQPVYPEYPTSVELSDGAIYTAEDALKNGEVIRHGDVYKITDLTTPCNDCEELTVYERERLIADIPDWCAIESEVIYRARNACKKRHYKSFANLCRKIAKEDGLKILRYQTAGGKRKPSAGLYGANRAYPATSSVDTDDFWQAACARADDKYQEIHHDNFDLQDFYNAAVQRSYN